MNPTIKPGGPTLPQPATSGTRPNVASNAEGSAPGRASAGAVQSNDRVQLTESARAIGAATQSADAPVDSQRVEQIRQAIAAGTYKVDAHSVADRIISLDKQIG